MAKVTIEQAQKLNSNPQSYPYFSLKNDGDRAKVKFAYNSISDIETFSLHEVEINGKKRYVDCLRDIDGNGKCPFCDKKFKLVTKTFFKLYNADTDTIQIWERGIKQAPALENMLKMSRSPKIVNDSYEIVRHGKPGSMDTHYELVYKASDETTLEDLPTAPELYGHWILQKTAEEMEYFITNNEFPQVKSNETGQTGSEDAGVNKRIKRMAF